MGELKLTIISIEGGVVTLGIEPDNVVWEKELRERYHKITLPAMERTMWIMEGGERSD